MALKRSEYLRDHDPVFVLTPEDARTIVWANEAEQALQDKRREESPDRGLALDEMTIAGVFEWDHLVWKAKKVLALQEVMDRPPESPYER